MSTPYGLSRTRTKPSQSFLVGVLLLAVLYASIMSREITEPYFGLHSWAQAHASWLARAHVDYGLGYTKGLLTWAVGMPPPESPARYLDHPQLPGLLDAVSLHLFGINDWALRLTGLLVSILSLVAVVALLRRIYDETTALLAGLLYVLFPITGYFYFVGYWLVPMTILAYWCYITLIGGFRDKAEPRLIHFIGLGTALFLMVQLSWLGFMYAAAIGTHYMIFSLQKRSLPDLKLFLVLLLAPLVSLALVMTILMAARDWNYQQIIDLYTWRSTISDGATRSTAKWWANFFYLLRTNYTLPILVLAAASFFVEFVRWSRSQVASKPGISAAPSGMPIEQNEAISSFQYVWIFLAPGVFYVAVFSETMWVHQYMYSPFSLFLAIAAALAIQGLRAKLIARHRVMANITTAIVFITVFVFCSVGLNTYHEIETYAPKKIEMFKNLSNRIKPDQSLLSYESYVVNENPAKGSFYRPEIAWYLNRNIVVAKSLPEIQKYAATGRFPYYLISDTSTPLFLQLKKNYTYEYVQGRPATAMTAGMASYHIFNLQNKRN